MAIVHNVHRSSFLDGVAVQVRIARYLFHGRQPWSVGYQEYKEHVLRSLVVQPHLLDCFSAEEQLPAGYGVALDERLIEYPWLLARLGSGHGRLLDAGATLNHDWILHHPVLAGRQITVCTLTAERMVVRPRVGYVYADLRAAPFEAGSFADIACISTLEHIGMDNTAVYGAPASFKEADAAAYLQAISEFKRLLRRGGRLFITVPFGRRAQFGWQQQFDRVELDRLIGRFDGTGVHPAFFRYDARGWRRASAAECADCEYYDVRQSVGCDEDHAAAARAVACLELTK